MSARTCEFLNVIWPLEAIFSNLLAHSAGAGLLHILFLHDGIAFYVPGSYLRGVKCRILFQWVEKMLH